MWVDASIRFNTKQNIEKLVAMGRDDLLVLRGSGNVAARTLPRMFYNFFDEEPCMFRDKQEIQTGFFMLKVNNFTIENILKPWIFCALTIDCIVPKDGAKKHYPCSKLDIYGRCHRYEQSAWAIILYRLYGSEIEKRKVGYQGPLLHVRRDKLKLEPLV